MDKDPTWGEYRMLVHVVIFESHKNFEREIVLSDETVKSLGLEG